MKIRELSVLVYHELLFNFLSEICLLFSDCYGGCHNMIKEEEPEARIAMCKCNEAGGKTYGVRFQRHTNMWQYTWAFEMKESVAKREGYDNTEITGGISPSEEYPGCPYCGAYYFTICGTCHHLNCNNDSDKMFRCGWCGDTGVLIDYDGFGIASAGDR